MSTEKKFPSRVPGYILIIIIISQFAGTSVWFAGNAVLPDLLRTFGNDPHGIRTITMAVQLGFIAGTLVFALFAVADRIRPSLVFFLSSCFAALANFLVLEAGSYETVLLLRFITGFFLAGIYPVGMKIAADWYDKGLGKALGYLVGALVLGTALPHLLRSFGVNYNWHMVMILTSACAFIGGVLVLAFVPVGPYRKKALQFRMTGLFSSFSIKEFRSASFGYFGHMWELYTFWAFVPLIIQLHNQISGDSLNIPLFSFLVIGSGALSCSIGGIISKRTGSKPVAGISLACSAACCILSYFFITAATNIFIPFLVFWGITVASDSPQFSALVASSAPSSQKGTALTIVISIGFAITVVCIFLFDALLQIASLLQVLPWLSIGPILGLYALYNEREKNLQI